MCKVPASKEALPLKDQKNDPSQGKPTVPAGRNLGEIGRKDSVELALKEVSEGSLAIRCAPLQYDYCIYQNRPFMTELLVKLTLVPKLEHHTTLTMKKKRNYLTF